MNTFSVVAVLLVAAPCTAFQNHGKNANQLVSRMDNQEKLIALQQRQIDLLNGKISRESSSFAQAARQVTGSPSKKAENEKKLDEQPTFSSITGINLCWVCCQLKPFLKKSDVDQVQLKVGPDGPQELCSISWDDVKTWMSYPGNGFLDYFPGTTPHVMTSFVDTAVLPNSWQAANLNSWQSGALSTTDTSDTYVNTNTVLLAGTDADSTKYKVRGSAWSRQDVLSNSAEFDLGQAPSNYVSCECPSAQMVGSALSDAESVTKQEEDEIAELKADIKDLEEKLRTQNASSVPGP